MNYFVLSTWFQVLTKISQRLSDLMKVTVYGFPISVSSCSSILQSEIAVYKVINITSLISIHLKYQATGHQEPVA
jgi:hypothetical protein